MSRDKGKESSALDGLTVSPALDTVIQAAQVPPPYSPVDGRVVRVFVVCAVLGMAASGVAELLAGLINAITNVSYYGEFAFHHRGPAEAVPALGAWSILVPVAGAFVIGVMARYGSSAIRGHGIPEAMEQVLTNESRVPARITLLKPVSAAVSIGTGGPFGSEGPIIATGGALGSLLGQWISVTASERKTLLAAGAAAGMAATFGSPVSAVLLAIELLLFEFRPRSFLPVAIAVCSAMAGRSTFHSWGPVFPIPDLPAVEAGALAMYVLVGGLAGAAAILVTRVVYAIEDTFERLPIHWMWWPAIGAVVVGVVGCVSPRSLGVGYFNIIDILSSRLTLSALAFLCALKFVSWSVALGSGTSGGTLAPLLTVGAGFGAIAGAGLGAAVPSLGLDPRMAALVGMAALFAGASRATLASAVFAFETTHQITAILPLLGGCAAAYLVASLKSPNSIMTEKIARRGIRTPEEYHADPLDQVLVSAICSRQVATLRSHQKLGAAREWLASGADGASHQGFPVMDEGGHLVGFLTRRDIRSTSVPPDHPLSSVFAHPVRYVYDDTTVRQAADHMVNHSIGRLPVVSRAKPHALVGIITRSDVLSVFQRRVQESEIQPSTLARRIPRRILKSHGD